MSRRGSWARRNAHSRPIRCTNRGARRVTPATTSIAPPTPIENATPSSGPQRPMKYSLRGDDLGGVDRHVLGARAFADEPIAAARRLGHVDAVDRAAEHLRAVGDGGHAKASSRLAARA